MGKGSLRGQETSAEHRDTHSAKLPLQQMQAKEI